MDSTQNAKKSRKTLTTLYGISEHLPTPDNMAAYLETRVEEANGDAARGMSQVAREAGFGIYR